MESKPVTIGVAQSRTQKTYDEILRRDDPRWVRLREIILEKSLQTGNFILSSGRTSKFLFQLRQTTMLPEGAALIGEIVVEYMQRFGLRCVGGMELGAVPIVSAISVASHNMKYPVDSFFVRKKAKEHGARELIDGHVTDGEEVLLVDDVATSGKSMFGTVAGVHQQYPNCFVRRALVIVDRQEGATEALLDKGIQLVSLFKKSDFPIPA
ncbi:MAG: orotate phosphoribosyltransferase [Alphaproteobacteria bacterium]|nr:orotate phosphoribosyltransferase [Alphaproteobacteria bacterium]MDE2109862.1 orotate phosphoribosyltransferase [Alphaproteobacteria bacterium]MDE2493546.1 orotate phosphoribosyltransferase [Alphaproteobacteria bacterium]